MKSSVSEILTELVIWIGCLFIKTISVKELHLRFAMSWNGSQTENSSQRTHPLQQNHFFSIEDTEW